MKKIIVLLVIFNTLITFGQTAQEYFQSGITKHNQNDFKEAIEFYNMAIEIDNQFRDAYFNRGNCKLALKDFNSALNDFNKTIELDSKFSKAYYNRATVLINIDKYTEALNDLDKTIALDNYNSKALNLRGQIRVHFNDKSGACDDFNKSKELGDKLAEKYIVNYCNSEPKKGEYLMLDWPDEENWKVGDDQENSQQRVIDLIHENETIDNWTELGNMTSIKGVVGIPVEKSMNLMFEEAKKNSVGAKLTFLEKNESTEYPWILFTIESPNFINDNKPESQLWYIINGKQGLYTNFIAIKNATIPKEFILKWSNFFKTGKIVYK